MDRFRFIIVAAGALALGTFAGAAAQAAVQGGASAIRAASENGALTEQAQFRFGGYDYCWADDGWRGPGWYWCGYAYRPGLGWGGGIGWNNWRRGVSRSRRFPRRAPRVSRISRPRRPGPRPRRPAALLGDSDGSRRRTNTP